MEAQSDGGKGLGTEVVAPFEARAACSGASGCPPPGEPQEAPGPCRCDMEGAWPPLVLLPLRHSPSRPHGPSRVPAASPGGPPRPSQAGSPMGRLFACWGECLSPPAPAGCKRGQDPSCHPAGALPGNPRRPCTAQATRSCGGERPPRPQSSGYWGTVLCRGSRWQGGVQESETVRMEELPGDKPREAPSHAAGGDVGTVWGGVGGPHVPLPHAQPACDAALVQFGSSPPAPCPGSSSHHRPAPGAPARTPPRPRAWPGCARGAVHEGLAGRAWGRR